MILHTIAACVTFCAAMVVAQEQTCRDIQYTFSASELHYLSPRSPAIGLTYATLCVWVTTDDKGEFSGTVGSYHANGVPDTVLLEGIPGGIRFAINGYIHETERAMPPNSEQHLCALLYLPDNYVKLYLNGTAGPTLEYTKTEIGSVPAGGVEVLGQRQGCEGGCFDPKRAFNGRMRNPLIWLRTLSEKELTALHQETCANDFVKNYSPETIFPHGRFFPYSDCTKSEHTISNAGGSVEYLTLKNLVPDLQSASICARVTTDNNGMVPGTVGSIATDDSVDRVVATGVMVEGTPSLRLYVDGKVILMPTILDSNTEYHFCVVLSSRFEKVLVFLNGLPALELILANLQPISAGSTIIIGQRQGCLGGCFVSQDAFTGKLNDFAIWNRVLSAAEIKAMALSDKCPTGHVVDLTKDNISEHKM